ncbi:hypothetical protein ACUNGZ_17395, partial [Serratia sp. IR-2025]
KKNSQNPHGAGKNPGPINPITKLNTVTAKNTRPLQIVVPAITRRRDAYRFVPALGAERVEVAVMMFSLQTREA